MAGILWIIVSLTAGLGLYFLIPATVLAAPIEIRKKVGESYLKKGAKCLKQFSFVRRVLSGYDILPISVDAEQKQLKVTLDANAIGDDEEYPFTDPDNRVKRLWNKQVSTNFELIPAAVDAELAELGHWVKEKRVNEGLIDGDPQQDWENVTVDPYVNMDTGLRLIDPIDVYEITPNDIDPENIKTAEAHTHQRYAQYGGRVELTDILAVLMGFGVGMMAMGGAAYIKTRILRGGSGGGSIGGSISVPGLYIDPSHLIDAVVMFL